MKLDKTIKNIIFGILSFLLINIVFRITGITLESGQWLITLFLILIYFEIMDLPKKK